MFVFRWCHIQRQERSLPEKARSRMDWRRRAARWRLAATTASCSSMTLNLRSASATMCFCSAFGGIGIGSDFSFVILIDARFVVCLPPSKKNFCPVLAYPTGVEDFCAENYAKIDEPCQGQKWRKAGAQSDQSRLCGPAFTGKNRGCAVRNPGRRRRSFSRHPGTTRRWTGLVFWRPSPPP